MICTGGVYGNYRIDDTIFPVPATQWEEQVIGMGLNGIPINSTYRLHTWNFASLEGSFAKLLFDKFAEQQAGNAQLSSIETDPYGADLVNENYGTTTYTDYTIVAISNRARGLPFFENISVTFEIEAS